MKELLYKEFRLALHPTNIIFMLFPVMLLIPNYPFLVTYFYVGLSIFFLCLGGRENHDIEYSIGLPIEKKDIVSARFLVVAFLELLSIVISIPFAIIRRTLLNGMINEAGSTTNLAFFGFAFLAYGIFNIIFFIRYYKNPNKVGSSFVLASTGMFLLIVIDVVLSHVPALNKVLESFDSESFVLRLCIFIVGIVLYFALSCVSYIVSKKYFEKLDL